MSLICTAGNTVVPALLVLEKLGFVIHLERVAGSDQIRVVRGEESYVAQDPVAVLGLVKLIEERGWEWQPSEAEISAAIERYELG